MTSADFTWKSGSVALTERTKKALKAVKDRDPEIRKMNVNDPDFKIRRLALQQFYLHTATHGFGGFDFSPRSASVQTVFHMNKPHDRDILREMCDKSGADPVELLDEACRWFCRQHGVEPDAVEFDWGHPLTRPGSNVLHVRFGRTLQSDDNAPSS